eukprot:CAMPEP_0173460024 /NCGR_PEP_ID=MMETSP1357-20121228/62429_1 /TAXON_ID=77926 /ORGANISM="Hemiselmis rufescens, Strain PCC563" /LENGTH=59 /DNA_ID=CAMNT_0014427551 /DNA_START=164 /DNA_END=341 /DNA_ORIENTATION=+
MPQTSDLARLALFQVDVRIGGEGVEVFGTHMVSRQVHGWVHALLRQAIGHLNVLRKRLK